MINKNTFKQNVVSSFLWSFLGQSGYLVIGLVANIILARLLSPYEFGQVGIIMFFIAIARVLTESGLSGALIRKSDATEEDFSTVFLFNLGVSVTLMLLLILFSEKIANFYNDLELKNILIATSSILLINAFQITQNAKLVKDLKFKEKATYEFVAIFFASLLGVVLAIQNAGVWALVIMQIATALFLTILLWLFEGPLKKLVFSRISFKGLYKFGVNTTLASLLNTAFDNVYQLILGKYFSINQTGFYFQGKKLQDVPVKIIRSTTSGVIYSSLAKLQNEHSLFNKFYRKILTVFTVVVGLICLMVFFYAENVILLLYGEQWLGAVFYIQILIVASYFYMQESLNRIIFKVFDKTEKILYLEIIKKSIQAITVAIGVLSESIEILLYGFLFTSILSFFLNYYQSRKVQNNFSWQELYIILKVGVISIFTVSTGLTLKEYFELQLYYSFLLIPILLIIFISAVKLFNVSDILRDSRAILNVIRKK
ncbi:lipopolysaccharide biosynthesis protein [Salegentibacter mishustinae]|uniref:lipopolysaccharide biosynthesis protein n=1 Tax=Salegentibacter mishustinae TaxID=270918 RepID=UPI002490A4D0|nr:lipopolysaccharide biosynthesis protein [Salegentibacter mishustinae]